MEVGVDLAGLLLCVSSEIGGEQLVLLTFQFTILPTAFLQPNWSITNVLSLHLGKAGQEVLGVSKRDEAIAPCLASSLVSNNSCLLKTGVLPEDSRKHFVGDLISEVSAEYSIIGFVPVLHSLVFPNATCCFSESHFGLLPRFLYLLDPRGLGSGRLLLVLLLLSLGSFISSLLRSIRDYIRRNYLCRLHWKNRLDLEFVLLLIHHSLELELEEAELFVLGGFHLRWQHGILL